MLTDFTLPLLEIDALAKIMIGVVGFIGSLVWIFAKRYLQGDQRYSKFVVKLVFLCLTVMLMICADNLVLFFCTWCLSNGLLVSLMVHKAGWRAATASGWLAARTFSLGAAFLAGGFIALYLMTGELSIQKIIHLTRLLGSEQLLLTLPLGCLLVAAMTQSAIWPFHRWLLSSLNSPTPVSAMMHAGLINGGGLLLARFAPLYLIEIDLLLMIFIVGLVTALVGTLMKLMQHDYKRMLACSTMSQMGFMLLQCGLGLFPAAVAHLCWHGLFKATLFLGSGSAAQDKRELSKASPPLRTLILGLSSGLLGSYCFAIASGKDWFVIDSTLVLVGIAFLMTAQLSITLLTELQRQGIWFAPLMSALVGAGYGWSVFSITHFLAGLPLSAAQPLHAVHILGLAVLALSWLAILYRHQLAKTRVLQQLIKPSYVRLLNMSQPHPATITSHRNDYHY